MRRALSFPAQGWAGNLSVESSRPSKGTVGLMCRPVRDKFRVPATERFGNVAVPANGPVGGQGLLKMFQRNLIPLEAVPARLRRREDDHANGFRQTACDSKGISCLRTSD